MASFPPQAFNKEALGELWKVDGEAPQGVRPCVQAFMETYVRWVSSRPVIGARNRCLDQGPEG
jgi:hypothetical protein